MSIDANNMSRVWIARDPKSLPLARLTATESSVFVLFEVERYGRNDPARLVNESGVISRPSVPTQGRI